jgi:hypothetical protein
MTEKGGRMNNIDCIANIVLYRQLRGEVESLYIDVVGIIANIDE